MATNVGEGGAGTDGNAARDVINEAQLIEVP
jgi:hypothetical protein